MPRILRKAGVVLAVVALLAGAIYGGMHMLKTKPTQADLAYADLSDRNVMDVYLPEGVANPPVVMWIHGGAFMLGDKSDPQSLDALLAAGFAVAAINYRLTDTAIWPAQLEDVTAAVRYVRSNADTLGVDGTRIALFGASAGGFLASTAGIALAADPATAVSAVVNWFGPVQFTTMDADIEATGVTRATGRNDADDSPESRLVGKSVSDDPAAAEQVSPLAYIARATTPLPAFLIMHGDADTYIGRGQSERLADALGASPHQSGVMYQIVAGGGHGSGTFQDAATTQLLVDFLKALFP
jgi:acetyl esterase/lipase